MHAFDDRVIGSNYISMFRDCVKAHEEGFEILLTPYDRKIIPIFISIMYNRHESYKEYSQAVDKFYSISKGFDTEGDMELYFSLTKYHPGHTCLVI